MRMDHISYAAAPDGLVASSKRIGELLGADLYDGGVHPRFGTRNMILPLRGGLYLEVVEALEHPASDKAPFGAAVKARTAQGGGWLCWSVSTGNMEKIERRLGRPWADGNRHLPDGTELLWKQIGVLNTAADPQLPYFIHWISSFDVHPGNAPSDITLETLEISGDSHRLREWLGEELDERIDYYTGNPAEDVKIDWVAEHGAPGIAACVFRTSAGDVRI